MERPNDLGAAVLSGFTEISDVDLENFLNLDLPDLDFDAYLNFDLAEKDTDMSDCDGKLAFPGPSPAPSGGLHVEMNVIDPLLAPHAWTEGNIVEPQPPAYEQLTAPQALMSDYQIMHRGTQGHTLTPQPVPGVIYDSQGCVIPPSKGRKQCVSRWVPCSPPPQLSNTQVASQSTHINAGGYLPGPPGKQNLPFAEGPLGSHLPSLAPQMGNPTLMQSIRGSDLDAANRLQGQVNKLPMASSPAADKEYPVPKSVAIDHQPKPKFETKSRTAKNPTKPRLRKPLLLTKPNPRYAPHPKYKPLPRPPSPWSIYTYTTHGELTPSRLYTPTELTTFLFTHPHPHTLTLRIHRNAPDSRRRFPTNHSHRCRFTTCPMYPNNTINQGHIGVSISEDADASQRDPFLVAAWVHLYCLERFTDFIRICRELNIEADARDLPWEARGKNPFRLSTPAEEKCVRGFIRACQSAGAGGPIDYPRFDMPDRPHEGTLTHRLACVKLKREPSSVGKQRELREQAAGYRGSTLDVHVGDLEVEARVRGWTRCHRNQNQLVVKPRVPRKYQGACFVRRAEDEDEDEDEEDEDAEGEVEDGEDEEGEPAWVAAAREPVFECQPQKRSRGNKRSREGALDDRIAAEKVESSSDDDDSAEDEDEDEADADALEQQKQELELKLTELKKKQMIKAGKRAKTEAESEDDDDDVVVPSRKRARK